MFPKYLQTYFMLYYSQNITYSTFINALFHLIVNDRLLLFITIAWNKHKLRSEGISSEGNGNALTKDNK